LEDTLVPPPPPPFAVIKPEVAAVNTADPAPNVESDPVAPALLVELPAPKLPTVIE
jgi:hypothetical protein